MTGSDSSDARSSQSHPRRQPQSDYKKYGARHRARRRAVEVLFEAEARGVDGRDVVIERRGLAAGDDSFSSVPAYTETLVAGVTADREQIDSLVSSHLRDWTLERLPAVDRAILRLGAWELFHAPDVPPVVVVDQAVEIARELSTDTSPNYVNGVLAALTPLAEQARAAAADAPGEPGAGVPTETGGPAAG